MLQDEKESVTRTEGTGLAPKSPIGKIFNQKFGAVFSTVTFFSFYGSDIPNPGRFERLKTWVKSS